MNRVPINKKDVDSIFVLGFTSMMVYGWKGMKKGFLELYMERAISVLL